MIHSNFISGFKLKKAKEFIFISMTYLASTHKVTLNDIIIREKKL